MNKIKIEIVAFLLIFVLSGCVKKNKNTFANDLNIENSILIKNINIDPNVNKIVESQNTPPLGEKINETDYEAVIFDVIKHAENKETDYQVTASGPVLNGQPIISFYLEGEIITILWEYPSNRLKYSDKVYYINNQNSLNSLYNLCKYDSTK